MPLNMHGMIMITRLIFTLVFCGFCLAAAPSSEPAIDNTRVTELVAQLNAPAPKDREQAAAELRKLGPAVIPVLEKAAEGSSFETRNQIGKIIGDFRVRGAIVLGVIVNEPAEWLLRLEPGDVITKVNRLNVDSYEDFLKKAAPLENSTRTFTVRTGVRVPHPHVKASRVPAERTIEAGPGKIGAYLGDYDASYGEALSTAMQQIARNRLEPMWADARKKFEEAIAAGLVFDDNSMLEPMYAAACYYSGDRTAAYERFEMYARRNSDAHPWRALMRNLGQIVPIDGHLHLHFARQHMKAHPDAVTGVLEIARVYSWTQNRYFEAATNALSALDGIPAKPDDASRGSALNSLQNALDAMGLLPEAGEVIEQLANVEDARNQWSYAFQAAERSGRYKAALKFGAEYAEGSRWAKQQSDLAARMFRLCLEEGWLDRAEEILDSFDDPTSMNHLLWQLRDCDLRWAESQSMLASFARRCLETESTQEDRDACVAAFRILSRLTNPGAEELEELTTRLKTCGRWSRDGEMTDWRRYLPAMLAMMKEKYADAVQLVARDKDDKSLGVGLDSKGDVLPASFRLAAEFLNRHGSELTDEKALWKRTFRAFKRPAGGYYVLTRDQHIGWSDGQKAREIPLPEAVWSFSDLNRAFVVSTSGKTVLATGLGRVYKLRTDETGWDLLCSLPPRSDWFYWTALEPVLDELAAILQEGGEHRDLVWPDKRPEYRENDYPQFFMLSDGTWIGFDPVAKELLRIPREKLAQQAQGPVQIYCIRGWGSKKTSQWVFTSNGLFEWEPQSGQITRAVLPGIDRPLPVMDATKQFRIFGSIRVALFPNDGGTTFLLNESTGKISPEGLVNEAYPETYWRQQPTETKRKQFKEAIAKAGLSWPPPVASTQPSQ